MSRTSPQQRPGRKEQRVQRRWSFNRRSNWALLSAPILAVAGVAVVGGIPAEAHSAPAAAHILIPNKTNNLDCNGWSPNDRPIPPPHRGPCTEPHGPVATSYS